MRCTEYDAFWVDGCHCYLILRFEPRPSGCCWSAVWLPFTMILRLRVQGQGRAFLNSYRYLSNCSYRR